MQGGVAMEHVGARELKNRLGHYLRVVQQGTTLVVTARGKAVARLVPVHGEGESGLAPELEERMWELTSAGVLTWSGGAFQVPKPAATNQGKKLLSDVVLEDRE
jgi:prevent-host-death family protein